MADSQTEHYSSAATLARDGHYLEATVKYHEATLAKHLARLDRTLERVTSSADRSRKQIAEGDTLYTLQEVRSDAARLIEEITKVTSAQEALQDAEISVKCAKEDKSVRGAKGRLDDAAAAIEGRDPALAALIRERALIHLQAEQSELALAAAEDAAKRSEDRAKRNARPLGKVEKEVLLETGANGKKRSWSARINKAIDSLVDRGYLKVGENQESRHLSQRIYHITETGSKAKASLLTS